MFDTAKCFSMFHKQRIFNGFSSLILQNIRIDIPTSDIFRILFSFFIRSFTVTAEWERTMRFAIQIVENLMIFEGKSKLASWQKKHFLPLLNFPSPYEIVVITME